MERKPLKRFGAMVATGAIALLLIGCNGSAGPNGVNGTNGINGVNGVNGVNGQNGIPGHSVAPINAGDLNNAAFAALSLKGSVLSVDMSMGTPKVTFMVTDQNGNGIAGLGQPGPDGLSKHMAFTIAKLIPANATTGAPSRWVNYEFVVPANGATPAALTGFPDPESTGTLVDNLDGSYVYTYNLDITKAATVAAGVKLATGQLLTDLDDLTYYPTMVHRIVILVGGAAGGTAVAKPANIFYDFLPSAPNAALPAATDTRTIVNVTACNGCHTKLTLHANYMPPVVDTKACVICHTDQMKFGAGESRVAGTTALVPAGTYGSTLKMDGTAVPLFPNFIHKIHMGDQLSMSGYSLFGTPINATQFPQDVRNCVVCHSDAAASSLPGTGAVAPVTANGAAWYSNPSRMACASCHDTVTFASSVVNGVTIAATHAAGAYSDDSTCATCHSKTDLPISHAPIYPYGTALNPTSATAKTTATKSSNPDATKALGAHKLAWNILSVTLDAAFHPEMTFQVLQDGQAIALNNAPAAGSTNVMIIPNYLNGPTVYFRGAVPQDGIIPADVNFRLSASLQNIWAQVPSVTVAGSTTKIVAGTLSGPATVGTATNVYTIVYTSATLPANLTMLQGALAGFSTETDINPSNPNSVLAATDFTAFGNTSGDGVTTVGGVVIPTVAVVKDATPFTTTAGTANGKSLTRRSILKSDACLSCHGNLGFFTSSSIHSGTYNNPNLCCTCHNTTQSDGTGYSINIKNWVHSIHSGGFRTYAFTAAAPAPAGDWQVGYPGLLNDCEACHVPGAYAYANADQQAQLPNMLWNSITQAYSATKTSPMAGSIATGSYQAPGLKPTNTGGAAIVTNFTTGATTYGVTAPTATSAVTSPMTATCTGCHDSAPAVAHMVNNGGVFYSLRSAAYTAGTTNLVANEQCMICHGAGTVMDIQAVHAF